MGKFDIRPFLCLFLSMVMIIPFNIPTEGSTPHILGIDPLYVGPHSTYLNLQDAIDNCINGGTIIIANGSYVGPFFLNTSNVRIIGNSSDDCIIKTDPVPDKSISSFTVVSDDVQISGLRFVTDSEGVCGLTGCASDNLYVHSVSFSVGNASKGAKFFHCQNIDFNLVEFDQTGCLSTGISLVNSSVRIRGSFFSVMGEGSVGINAEGSSLGLTLNEVNSSGRNGICIKLKRSTMDQCHDNDYSCSGIGSVGIETDTSVRCSYDDTIHVSGDGSCGILTSGSERLFIEYISLWLIGKNCSGIRSDGVPISIHSVIVDGTGPNSRAVSCNNSTLDVFTSRFEISGVGSCAIFNNNGVELRSNHNRYILSHPSAMAFSIDGMGTLEMSRDYFNILTQNSLIGTLNDVNKLNIYDFSFDGPSAEFAMTIGNSTDVSIGSTDDTHRMNIDIYNSTQLEIGGYLKELRMSSCRDVSIDSGSGTNFDLTGSSDIRINAFKFKNTTTGIKLNDCSDVKIVNSKFENVGTAIRTEKAKDLTLEGITVNSHQTALVLTNSTAILKNCFLRSDFSIFRLSGGSTDCYDNDISGEVHYGPICGNLSFYQDLDVKIDAYYEIKLHVRVWSGDTNVVDTIIPFGIQDRSEEFRCREMKYLKTTGGLLTEVYSGIELTENVTGYHYVLYPLYLDRPIDIDILVNLTEPPRPTMDLPPIYTKNRGVEISGSADPQTNVTVLVGNVQYFTLSDHNGRYGVMVDLLEGKNEIIARSVSDVNIASPPTPVRIVTLDTVSPVARGSIEYHTEVPGMIILNGSLSFDENGIWEYTWIIGDRIRKDAITGLDIESLPLDGTVLAILTVTDPAGNSDDEIVPIDLTSLIRPIIKYTIPGNGAWGVFADASIQIAFSLPMTRSDPRTCFSVDPDANYSYDWDERGTVLALSFVEELLPDTRYVIGIRNMTSRSGMLMDPDTFDLEFRTGTESIYVKIRGPDPEIGLPLGEPFSVWGESNGLKRNEIITVTFLDKTYWIVPFENGTWRIDLLGPDKPGEFDLKVSTEWAEDTVSLKFVRESDRLPRIIVIWIIMLIVIASISAILIFDLVMRRKKSGGIGDGPRWED